MTSRQRVLVLVLLCLTALGLAPARAEQMQTGATQMPPPGAGGLILGVTWVERPDVTQLDATRNIRLYTYMYNNSTQPQVIDWRTRRLISSKLSATISDPEFYGMVVIPPGDVVLMKSFFYYKTGFPGHFTFSVRDQDQHIYSVAAVPRATNVGDFSLLPVGVQQRLIETFLQAQPNFFKWWYRDY